MEEATMKKLCRDCNYLTDEGHELDPLGQWKHCQLWDKEVLENTYTCDDWVEVELIWPGESEGE